MADVDGTSRGFPWGSGWLAVSPQRTPSCGVMLEDIGASPRVVAQHLAVSERAVIQAWLERKPLSRAAHLALFYETKWGRSLVDTKTTNEAALYGGLMLKLKDEVARLREQLERFGQLADFGSANDPSPDIVLRRPTLAEVEQAGALVGVSPERISFAPKELKLWRAA